MTAPARRFPAARAVALAMAVASSSCAGMHPPARAWAPPRERVSREALPDGTVAVVRERRTLPLVAIRVAWPVGAATDPAGRRGLGTLAARVLPDGRCARGGVTLAEAVEGLGAEITAETDDETSSIGVLVRTDAAAAAASALGGCLGGIAVDGAAVESARSVLVSDLTTLERDPEHLALAALGEALLGRGHPLALPAEGIAAEVARLGLPEVVDELARMLQAGRVVSVAGDVGEDDGLALARAVAASLPAAHGLERPKAPRPDPDGPFEGLVLVPMTGLVQVTVLAGRLLPPTDASRVLAREAGLVIRDAVARTKLVDEGRAYDVGYWSTQTLVGQLVIERASVRADAGPIAVSSLAGEVRAGRDWRPEYVAAIRSRVTAEHVLRAADLPARAHSDARCELAGLDCEPAAPWALRSIAPDLVVDELDGHVGHGWRAVVVADPARLESIAKAVPGAHHWWSLDGSSPAVGAPAATH